MGWGTGSSGTIADRIADAGAKATPASARAAWLSMRRTLTAKAIWQEEKPLVPERASEIENTVRAVLRDVLGLSADRVAAFHDETPLFGAVPELDSMAVAGVLTELEDRLGIMIEDDDIDGETLETFGSLTRFAIGKAVV
jgi:acyl carrier protein